MPQPHIAPSCSSHPFVWWWGRYHDAPDIEMNDTELLAKLDDAPADAIYFHPVNGWSLFTGLRDVTTLSACKLTSPELFQMAVNVAGENGDNTFLQLAEGLK